METAQKLGKREQNRINNESAILDAATECFSQFGFDKVTVRDIIRKTGLASGTFYNYFPDKTSIFKALVDQYQNLMTQNIATFTKDSETQKEKINACYTAFFTSIEQDPITFTLVHSNEKTVQDLYSDKYYDSLLNELSDIVTGNWEDQASESALLTAAFIGTANEIGSRLAKNGGDAKKAAHFATMVFIGGLERLKSEA